ncbi:MAG: response regulator [Alphaproteobacteria bacterium]|nr:response regulator [Alphaproteobacteria bacterium]
MPTEPTLPQKSLPHLRYVKVLIVDDDKRIAKLVKSVLNGLGFLSVHVEHSALEALQYMAKEEVDLIICDWVMEKMDGVQMVQKLRKDLTNPNQLVPIIMLSGNSEKPHIEKARDSGVTEYVMKPFTAKSLCSRIITVIENPRSFIISDSFTGHNRRRKVREYTGGDRRKPKK